jgi:hypothetical protein
MRCKRLWWEKEKDAIEPTTGTLVRLAAKYQEQLGSL